MDTGLKSGKFICAICGKKVEYFCDEPEWAWRNKETKFCSYSHMVRWLNEHEKKHRFGDCDDVGTDVLHDWDD